MKKTCINDLLGIFIYLQPGSMASSGMEDPYYTSSMSGASPRSGPPPIPAVPPVRAVQEVFILTFNIMYHEHLTCVQGFMPNS